MADIPDGVSDEAIKLALAWEIVKASLVKASSIRGEAPDLDALLVAFEKALLATKSAAQKSS